MDVVFLLDLDNTLIDNDRARDGLADATRRILGADLAREYWGVYEEVRHELGYVDSLETLARFHRRRSRAPGDALDRAILDFPYAEVRYPATLDVLDALWRVGTPVLLSDGDPTFQPLKIARSGIGAAVRGNVLVFTHKEEHLPDVARLFPARHYVAIDDKAAILGRIKSDWGDRVTTVHVRQGKYAGQPSDGPAPDMVVEGIAEVTAVLGRDEGRSVFEDETGTGRRS